MGSLLQDRNFSHWYGGILAILILSIYVLFKSRSSRKLKTPPEAAGAWPVVGHLPILAKSHLLHKTFASMADKYGSIFTIKLGLFPAVVVSSSEIAKECFTRHDLALASRPQLLASEVMGYNYAFVGLAPYGPYWREVRKITTLELLSGRRIESLLTPIVASATDIAIKELHKLWTEKKNDSGHILVDLKLWFARLSMNIILKAIAGKGYYSGIATVDEEEKRRCHHALREFLQHLGVFPMADALPFLRWLDLGGHEKSMKRTFKELDKLLTGWLEEHKRNGKYLREDKGDRDFMDVMLSTLNGMEIGGFDADTVIKATCLALIAGGVDTTMTTLTWAVSLLLNNLHVLKKTQEILEAQIGKQRHVKESDISNLTYLHAIVKETLRLHPPGPLGGPHISTEDCIINGHYVPKGTRLIFNIWKIHTDSRSWPEPMKFRPERFLNSQKDVDVKGLNFEYLPFGGGRRACPGMSFALQSTHSMLARFLHAFEVSTPNNLPVDMSEGLGITVEKATPLEVMLAPRLPNEVYEFT
ncbi:cytochrome P450 CYP82D47-like [Rhodamnia argentea]|uniref:Cytochrome P450 CYP82D47-like n=1 Tax=Rhodamnia argentea TaxID=178133 RepID=A0A8B8NG78_9MYRT|nr:cytochrome P450 CYP82D47-like [Rhodamnia argentea]